MLDNASKEPIRVYAKDGRKIDNIPDAVGKVKGGLVKCNGLMYGLCEDN